MNSIYAVVLELERTIRTNTDVADLSRISPIDGGHGDSTEADVERGACNSGFVSREPSWMSSSRR